MHGHAWSQNALRDDPSQNLQTCRACSAFVWQSRGCEKFTDKLRRAYSLLTANDEDQFLATLSEDGAFGVEAVSIDNRLISRDLLDSANEFSFLQESLGIAHWPPGTIVCDIGAGYGRWAHRASQCLPNLRIYSCDAIESSRQTCAAHLRLRGLHAAAADVMGASELARALASNIAAAAAAPSDGSPIARLAIFVHSLPEMASAPARREWLELLHDVPHLFVVSNHSALQPPDATVDLQHDDVSRQISRLSASAPLIDRCLHSRVNCLVTW